MDNNNLLLPPLPHANSSSPPSPPQCRAVVVDSLLCFVHNFRHLPHLRSVLIRHFTVPSFVRSLQLLTQLSPDPDDLIFPLCSSHPEEVHLLLHSLLLRFDRLSSCGQAPIFAASDLSSLPLRPNFVTSTDGAEIAGGEEESIKMGRSTVGDELRHIRFMLQRIFLLQQQLPVGRKESSPPFRDFVQQQHHHAIPSIATSSSSYSSSLSLFSQFGQSIFSSPECPIARPFPATTPKVGQTMETNAIASSSLMQSNRQTTANSNKNSNSSKGISPSKSRGRLDDVVEKLTRERRGISINGTTTNEVGKEEIGGEADEEQLSGTTTVVERQDEEEREATDQSVERQQKEEADIGQRQNNAADDRQQQLKQQQQQLQSLAMGTPRTNAATAAAAMASSYAMQMLHQLALGAGRFGGTMAPVQKQRQIDEEEEKQMKSQLIKRNQLEEEEAEERNEPMFEEEEDEDDIGSYENRMSEGANEEGEEMKRMDVNLMEQAGTSPTLSDESLAEMNNINDKDDEEKPLWCNWPNCQKRFRNKFLLKKHRFIHTGEKPHKCPFCAKMFNRKDNLLRHKKTHVQNGLAELGGLKRRHNMLYGVSAEEALMNGMIFPMDGGGTSTENQQHRRGTRRKSLAKAKEQRQATGEC